VVDPALPQPRLHDLQSLAQFAPHVGGRHTDAVEVQLGVAAGLVVVEAEHVGRPDRGQPGRIASVDQRRPARIPTR
jgi:hypothetical protein